LHVCSTWVFLFHSASFNVAKKSAAAARFSSSNARLIDILPPLSDHSGPLHKHLVHELLRVAGSRLDGWSGILPGISHSSYHLLWCSGLVRPMAFVVVEVFSQPGGQPSGPGLLRFVKLVLLHLVSSCHEIGNIIFSYDCFLIEASSVVQIFWSSCGHSTYQGHSHSHSRDMWHVTTQWCLSLK
jgi:hypothetical protein